MTCIDCGAETSDGVCFICDAEVVANITHDFNHRWAAYPEDCTECAAEAAESEMNQ